MTVNVVTVEILARTKDSLNILVYQLLISASDAFYGKACSCISEEPVFH